MRLTTVRTRANGFTLIELMIVVVIVGIIAAVAVPSYTSYIVKGKRAAAQAFMMDVASKEKQYLLDARAYTNNLSALGFASVPREVSDHYTVTVTVPGTLPPTFTVQAVPVVGGSQSGDGTLSLASDGTKSPTNKW